MPFVVRAEAPISQFNISSHCMHHVTYRICLKKPPHTLAIVYGCIVNALS